MGWKRINGCTYYYRQRQVNGRTVSEYVGPGEIGRRAEQEDAARRERRRAAKQAEKVAKEKLHSELAIFRKVQNDADTALRAALLAAGFHQHARGDWRKRKKC